MTERDDAWCWHLGGGEEGSGRFYEVMTGVEAVVVHASPTVMERGEKIYEVMTVDIAQHGKRRKIYEVMTGRKRRPRFL